MKGSIHWRLFSLRGAAPLVYCKRYQLGGASGPGVEEVDTVEETLCWEIQRKGDDFFLGTSQGGAVGESGKQEGGRWSFW